MNFIDEWLEAIKPYIHIANPVDFELLMATYWANQLPGIKVWLILRGPSASGGTRMLDLFMKAPAIVRISEVTHPGMEDLVRRIDESKDDQFPIHVVIIVDMTYVLGGSETDIHHDLRLVYDGSYIRQLGSTRFPYEQQRTFGLMAKATNAAMDTAAEWASRLGPRTIELRFTPPPRVVVEPLLDTEHRKLAAEVTRELILDWVKSGGEQFWDTLISKVGSIENPYREFLVGLANLVAHARAYIDRDQYDRTLASPVDPEHANRLFSQFDKLVRTLAVLKGHDRIEKEDAKAIMQVAMDSIPGWRYHVLDVLKDIKTGELPRDRVKEILGLTHEPKTYQSVERDLQLLGIVEVVEPKDVVRLLPGWTAILKMWKEREEEQEQPRPQVSTPALIGERLLEMWELPDDELAKQADEYDRQLAERYPTPDEKFTKVVAEKEDERMEQLAEEKSGSHAEEPEFEYNALGGAKLKVKKKGKKQD